MPVSGGAVLAAVALACVIYAGDKIGHGIHVGVVKTKHAIVHVVHPKKKAETK